MRMFKRYLPTVLALVSCLSLNLLHVFATEANMGIVNAAVSAVEDENTAAEVLENESLAGEVLTEEELLATKTLANGNSTNEAITNEETTVVDRDVGAGTERIAFTEDGFVMNEPDYVSEDGSIFYSNYYEVFGTDSEIFLYDSSYQIMPLQEGDLVTVSRGDEHKYYDGYYTREYWVANGAGDYLGACAEAEKDGPDGDSYSAAVLNDDVIKALLWIFQDDFYREAVFGDIDFGIQYINFHMCISYYYSGETSGAGTDLMNNVDNVLSFVQDQFLLNATNALKKMERYTAYVGVNDILQDIIWLEPNPVDLIISKRSLTDLTSGDGEKYLTGASFALYAWDGSAYSIKVADAKDNGDGTYTFSNISPNVAVDGKFLVVEKSAPSGYQTPYWNYNHAADKKSYSTYGGREFVLSSNGEWSCTSMSEHDTPELGFVFLNTPKQITLVLTKTDADTSEKLAGAEFELWAYRTSTSDYTYKVGTFTDNGDGTYTIKYDFDIATKSNGNYLYAVKEVKAPDGYALSTEPWIIKGISVNSSGVLKTSASSLSVVNYAEEGELQLKKVSSNPEITEENECYSLEGAEYTVYSDKNCTVSVGVLATDANGVSNTITLKTGTYYIKETKVPKGYLKDTTVYEVTLTSEHASKMLVIEVEDIPTMIPIEILLYKVDSETGMSASQGYATLAGAEFTVKYYALDTTTDPAEEGILPDRTWVFQADETGLIWYSDAQQIRGDELYLTEEGVPALPNGVVTIQETKAPEGYLLNDTVYVVPIKADGDNVSVSAYAIPTIPEDIWKMDFFKIEYGTNVPISGAVFEYIRPDGSKESLTTDENGTITVKGLEWGTHILREVSAPEGYCINANEIKFSVEENNTITVLSNAVVSDEDGNVTLEVKTDGNLEIIVEDKPVPYSLEIQKINENNIFLPGAEFGLYTDKDCSNEIQKGTTDSNGNLKFTDLIYGNTYYVKEIKAPEGYRLPESVIVYEIKAESSPIKDTWEFYVNGTKYTKEDTDSSQSVYVSGDDSERVLNLRIVNEIGLLLPETGSAATLCCFIVGASMMLCVFGLSKKDIKRKER